MKQIPYLRTTPMWFYPVSLLVTGGVIGALLVVWSVLPILILAFAAGWLNGAYLASTRKKIAELFENLPRKSHP
ncbi:MAG: hypothetical protein EPN21_08165 [Methylococcaceae bacterium]|nr:MAG: hypothetical protein EPN21_08165 [Methylococcaceae bacterium]